MPKITTKRDDEVISPDEMKNIITKCDSARTRSLMAFMYLLGCRVSEALRLKKDKIWFDNEAMYAKVFVLKRNKTRADGTKKDSSFEHTVKISLNAPFVDVIREYWDKVLPEQKIWIYSANPNSNRVIAWCEMKKVSPKIWPHLFRHTRMTRLAEQGATEMQLMTWAGWSDARPAKDYVSRSSTLIEELGKKLK